MANIDPNIALGVKPLQIENPMNQYAAMSQIQNAQNQNALAQYQLSSAKRADEGQNALSAAYRKAYNPEKGTVDNTLLRQEIANSGHGYLLPKVEAGILTQQKDQATLDKTVAETDKIKYDQRMKQYDRAISHIGALNTPKEAIASIDSSLAKGDIDQSKADMLKQSLAQAGPNFLGWKKNILMSSMDAKDQLHQEYQNRVATTGEKNAATNAGRLTLEKDKFNFDTNPQLQANLAEAKAKGEFFGKNKAAAQLALPGAIATAKQTIDLIDDMVGKPEIKDKNGKIIQEGTKPRAGFDDYVGFSYLPGQRFIEGSDAASFELRQKQIEGKAFLEAFETLKGGGSITEKEGEKGAAAIMRMNKASSKEEYIIAARELQDVLRAGIEVKAAKAGTTNNVAAPNKSGGIAPPPNFVIDKKPQ